MTTDIERARTLLKEVSTIIKRAKISPRAEKLLMLADDNIKHPEPRMLFDVLNLPEKERGAVDWENVFVTSEELCEVANVSKTTVRTLVNDGYLEQRHHGLYRMADFLDAWRDYQERPR